MAKPILPSSTIGFFGGGQLGRMAALAARRLGYRVRVFEPTIDGPTAHVSDLEVNASYDDLDAASKFAEGVDVLSFEFENIPHATLEAMEQICPVRPSPFVLQTCCHRLREKDWLSKFGFPVTRYRAVRSLEDLRRAAVDVGLPGILKTISFGYDGKGQSRIDRIDQLETAWSGIGGVPCILEALVPFDMELSVIAARSLDGQIVCYGPVMNEHRRHILDLSTVPVSLPHAVTREAIEIAQGIAREMEVVGVIAVEMFLVGRKVLVNELAPRPHNSGHYSIDACITSQFEQHVRAVCGLPLGDPTLIRPAAMANLLGDLWAHGEPDWRAALEMHDVKLHLYGKNKPEPGRKMGHLTVMANSPAAARARVIEARVRL